MKQYKGRFLVDRPYFRSRLKTLSPFFLGLRDVIISLSLQLEILILLSSYSITFSPDTSCLGHSLNELVLTGFLNILVLASCRQNSTNDTTLGGGG